MKGDWIYESRLDRWHLIWNTIDPEDPRHEAWCGFTHPIKDAVVKSGALINGMADTLHDECYRKSEELA